MRVVQSESDFTIAQGRFSYNEIPQRNNSATFSFRTILVFCSRLFSILLHRGFLFIPDYSTTFFIQAKAPWFLMVLQMFSKYMARFFKIYGPPGTEFRTRFTTCGADKKVSTTTVSTSRRGSQHGFRVVSMAIMPNMTGYDRRHKSVGGGSEVGRGVSERPRRRCFGGRRGGLNDIVSDIETRSIGIVSIGHLQWFCLVWNWKHQWESKPLLHFSLTMTCSWQSSICYHISKQ